MTEPIGNKLSIGGYGVVKKLTVEGIKESARKIHYGAGHDAILYLLEELDSAKKVQTVTDQSWRKLMEEREKLIEGLRWYADHETYCPATMDMEGPGAFDELVSYIEADEGQKARDILKSIGIEV